MTITPEQVQATLAAHGIKCVIVDKGNPDTSEHAELSIESKRAVTVWVSPTDDTVYVAKWHPHRGDYSCSNVYHFDHRGIPTLVKIIQRAMDSNRPLDRVP